MSARALSSLVLRELLKEIEKIREGITRPDEDWAEAMAVNYSRATQEQPVVYLTKEENDQTRKYLAWYKACGLDVADRATRFIRAKHATEIREFLKTESDYQPVSMEHDAIENIQHSLPRDNGTPTCFKEWFAVNQVWRLTLAMTEITLQDAAFGTPECCVDPLPKPWEDKLDECMQITDASTKLPIPRGGGLPITRHDLNTVLPTSYVDADLSGLLSNATIDAWFRILLSFRDQRQPGRTVVIHPDSLDLVAATPQQVTENAMLVNPKIEMVLFPIVIKERDHCILVVAFPKKHMVAVYDSLGSKSSKVLQKSRLWIERKDPQLGEMLWKVWWMDCPLQGEEVACGVFMCMNALFVCVDKDTQEQYSRRDTLFLRRYIAAVICMGKLPEKI